MDSYQHGGVETFVTVTGASEAEARKKLQDFGGDINAAIDSYLSEKEACVVPAHIEGAHSHFMAEDVPPSMDRIATQPFRPFPMPSRPTWSHRMPNAGGFGFEDMIRSRFPYRGMPPFVSQPRDIREIPIDWKEEEPRGRSNADVIIEEIPATDETWPSSQVQPHIDDEDIPGPSPKPSASGPRVAVLEDGTAINKDDDIEEEMLKAALEASEKQMKGMGISETSRGLQMRGNQLDCEDDDFMQAVSQSLKTAEQEQARREGKDVSHVTDILNHQAKDVEEEMLKAALEASQKEMTGIGLSQASSGARMYGNQQDAEDDEFMRAVSLSLKTAEQEKALREREESLQYSAHSNFQHSTRNDETSQTKGSPTSRDSHRTCQSDPTIKACPESKNATCMEINRTEWDDSGMGTGKELGTGKFSEKSYVEPDVEHENGITIMLRLPDGARQGRRFLKTEPLQYLFDFIEAKCGLHRGSYQLVRPYPRRVFGDTEFASSFQELGLTSKYETLFLEVN